MARKYSTTGNGAAGTTKTMLTVIGVATTRGWIYDVVIGSDATPADLAGNFTLSRFTAAGTATAVTPLALDQGNPAPLLTSGKNHSAEPTYAAGSELMQFGLNQRATFRWVAAPGGELVVPATAANGIGTRTSSHGGTPNVLATMHWDE